MSQVKFIFVIALFLASVVALSFFVKWTLMWYVIFFVSVVLILMSIGFGYIMGGVDQGYEDFGADGTSKQTDNLVYT